MLGPPTRDPVPSWPVLWSLQERRVLPKRLKVCKQLRQCGTGMLCQIFISELSSKSQRIRDHCSHKLTLRLAAQTVLVQAVLLFHSRPQYPALGVIDRILKQPHHMPLVVVRRSLSSLRQERYQLRATTPIPPPRPSHVCDRLTDALLHVLVDRVFLNPLKLLLQRPIRANVHLWIMQPDF